MLIGGFFRVVWRVVVMFFVTKVKGGIEKDGFCFIGILVFDLIFCIVIKVIMVIILEIVWVCFLYVN